MGSPGDLVIRVSNQLVSGMTLQSRNAKECFVKQNSFTECIPNFCWLHIIPALGTWVLMSTNVP